MGGMRDVDLEVNRSACSLKSPHPSVSLSPYPGSFQLDDEAPEVRVL